MTRDNDNESQHGIRATFEEYTVGDSAIARIGDPENPAAWIQSTVAVDVTK